MTNEKNSEFSKSQYPMKQKPREDIRVALLWGGWSDEREISHDSATACEKALKDAGFVHIVSLDVADNSTTERLLHDCWDVAFIAMHGEYGEDGCIQGLLEILHIPYTFSGVLASALASDKNRAKAVCKAAGIAVPASFTVCKEELAQRDALEIIETKLNSLVGSGELTGNREAATQPEALFVKPVHNGSSFGITRVVWESQQANQVVRTIAGALEVALAKDDVALVEEAIEGTEISVPVMGNADPCALPIIEIAMDTEFYDLKTKYEASELHHIIPARLDTAIYETAQQDAVKAHKALGCRGCSRSDFIVTKNGTPYLLETNTIPGMTETSLLPDSASREGISFAELCASFVELAQCDNK